MNKKHKLSLITVMAMLGVGGIIAPNSFADAPDCSAVTTENMLATCVETNTPATLGGDIELSKSFVIKGGYNLTIDMNEHKIIQQADSVAFEVRKGTLSLEGHGTVERIGDNPDDTHATIRIYGETTAQESPTSILSVGEGITISNNNDAGIYVEDNDNNSYYGIKVDFAGNISALQGIVISKNINITDGMPLINIKDNAKISATEHAIIADGFADWKINRATISGSTGIALVQGQFYIDGAKVTASGDNNADIYPNGPIVKMPNTGAAIQIQATKDLTDKSSFYVRNGSFTSEKGFAIAEYSANMNSNTTSLKDFKIYTGTLHGSEEVDGSVINSTTGAFPWFFSDGRMMESGSYSFEDTMERYDQHKMTVERYGEVDGLEALYNDPELFGYYLFFPAYRDSLYLQEPEEEALANSDYKDSHVAKIFDLSIFAFLGQDPDPTPGMTPIHDQITDTGEDTPISFTMPLPEVEAVEDGYIREYYILNFHLVDPRTGEYKVEKFPVELSEDGTSFTFETHKFSTFALAYKDTNLTPEPTPENPTVPDTGFGVNNETGEKNVASTLGLFMLAGSAITTYAGVKLYRKNH